MIMIYVHEIEHVCLCLYVSANYFYSSVLEKKKWMGTWDTNSDYNDLVHQFYLGDGLPIALNLKGYSSTYKGESTLKIKNTSTISDTEQDSLSVSQASFAEDVAPKKRKRKKKWNWHLAFRQPTDRPGGGSSKKWKLSHLNVLFLSSPMSSEMQMKTLMRCLLIIL